MKQRLVGLHSEAVRVSAASERACAAAEFVCAALTPCAADLELETLATPEHLDLALAAEELMRDLVRQLVWNYAQGLALHAAAVERAGRAWLFPASSGSGKSTLIVHLAARGFTFLTDELVFVPHAGAHVYPLARPAHLKPGSSFLLERHPALGRSKHVLRYAHGALIAPAAFAASGRASLPLGAVIFPRYAPDARASVQRLSAGLAGYSLVGALLNARNLPGLGIAASARLAAEVACYRVEYRTLEELDALLESIDVRGD